MKAPGGFLHIPARIFACIASTLEQGRDSNPTCLPRGLPRCFRAASAFNGFPT